MQKITLRAARVNMGLSRRDVAEKANISERAIEYYENGKRMPRVDILMRLLEIYNVSFEQIDFGI